MSRRDCFCCGRWRTTRRSSWAMCLHSCPPRCPTISNGNGRPNTLSPSPAHLSAPMRQSQLLSQRQMARGWRRVNWRRWKYERMLAAARSHRGCPGGISASPCPPGPITAPCPLPDEPFYPCDKTRILPLKVRR